MGAFPYREQFNVELPYFKGKNLKVMALYQKDDHRSNLLDDIYASPDLGVSMPKYRIPEEEHDPRVAYAAVHDELMLDGNSRQNLATFCQTYLDPEIHKLMDESVDKNMIDKDEYPQTAEIESRCVAMIADLWNSPDAVNTIGCSTTGSSEAAMLGGLAMKWKWRAKRQAQGKPIDKPNLICGPVQVCWHKFARYFDVELREIPMEHGRLLMSPEEVLKRCDENTIGVVPTLGVTFTLQFEDVKGVSEALDQLQKDTGLDIPIHVDAASGGFVAPFLYEELLWDFRLPRVKSINASGHKHGLSPLGVGWVVWREKQDLPEELIFNVNYLGGNMPTFALNFSRPGGQIIAQYYNFLRLGREGYRRIHQSCIDTGIYLAEEIAKSGLVEIIYDGRGGLPGCCYKLKEGLDTNYTLYDLSDRLRARGWQIASYSLPSNAQDTVIQRILVRHGFTHDLANLLLEDINRSIDFFRAHPVVKPMTREEAGGFNHS